MPHPTLTSYRLTPVLQKSVPGSIRNLFEFAPPTNPTLAASMTHEASIQTYYTIRYLADPPLREAAFRAYAYFRWVDDVIDQEQIGKAERLAFLARQQDIISRCYQGERPTNLRPKEQLVAELIHNDLKPQSGLRTYINEMMTVMAFDAERKGRLISEAELAEYTRALTTAVSEAMHYFIGHGQAAPQDESRYCAVTGAHITHLLRDAIEDTAAGYYNIPQEFLEAHQFDPADVTHNAYQSWVQKRVQLARRYFVAGRAAMAQVENRRCRLAGYAYIGRFELILNAIERDNYHLRPAYPERKSKKNVLKVILAALAQTIVGGGQWRVN